VKQLSQHDIQQVSGGQDGNQPVIGAIVGPLPLPFPFPPTPAPAPIPDPIYPPSIYHQEL
jgi:hypothetical protein